MPRATAAYLTLCTGRLTAEQCLPSRASSTGWCLARPADRRGAGGARRHGVRLLPPRRCRPPSSALPAVGPENSLRVSAYARHLDKEIAEGEDGAEGPRAFREKRRPVWKMR